MDGDVIGNGRSRNDDGVGGGVFAVQHYVPAAHIADGTSRRLLDNERISQLDIKAADGIVCPVGGHPGNAIPNGDGPISIDASASSFGFYGAAGDADRADAADAVFGSPLCFYRAAGDKDLAAIIIAEDTFFFSGGGDFAA